jgi:hypothetical protein
LYNLPAVRRLVGFMVLVTGAACQAPQLSPASQTDGGAAKAQLVSFAASLTETPNGASDQLRLEARIANLGQVPLNDVGAFNGTASFTNGLSLGATYGPNPSLSPAALAPGETGTFVFLANEPNLGLCNLATVCQANPHSGLLDTSARLISNIAAWDLSTDVAVTCADTFPKGCPSTLAEVCQPAGTDGGLGLHCVQSWTDVLAERLCGTATFDEITECTGGYQVRQLTIGTRSNNYIYASGVLVEVDGLEGYQDSCLGGPCDGPVVAASYLSCPEPAAFYSCSNGDAGPTMMPGSMPPDAGVRDGAFPRD